MSTGGFPMENEARDRISGRVFDIQRFSLHDGPGIRTTVFLKGCPLRCIWCHNPEGLSPHSQIMFDPARCIGCGECVSVCGAGAHISEDGKHMIDRKKCVSCGECAKVCPTGAIEIAGVEMTVSEVMSQVIRDKKYYAENGGITLSGGEPLMQPSFSAALLEACRENGIGTAIETSAHAGCGEFRSVVRFADIVLLDLKLADDESHRKYTGVTREKIEKNTKILSDEGIPVILRCPIIPGINDSEKHLAFAAKEAEKIGTVREIHIEPYHSIGISKNSLLGTEAAFSAPSMSSERAEDLAALLRSMTDITVKVSK